MWHVILSAAFLIYSVLGKDECSLSSKNSRLQLKTEKLLRLVTKLNCAEESRETVKTTQKPILNDEMCGKAFVPVSGNSKMVHCFISTYEYYFLNVGMIQLLNNFSFNNDFNPKSIDPKLCTHAELMGFVDVDADFQISLNSKYSNDFEKLLKMLKAKNVATILSINVHDKFSPDLYSKMASSEKERNNFLESLMVLMDNYDLDGFFANWEYPVFPDGELFKMKKEDSVNHAKLMQKVSMRLKERSKVLYSLGSCLPLYEKSYNFSSLANHVDLWLINSFHFERVLTTSISSSIKKLENCIQKYVKYVPSEKIVIGIPAFSYPDEINDNSKHTIGATLSKARWPSFPMLHTFRSICEEAGKGGLQIVHNETGDISSYAFKDKIWTSFESSMVIKRKMEIIKEKNLAGAYMSRMGHDDFDGKQCNCGKFYFLRSMNEWLRGDGSCLPPPCP